MSVEKTLRQAAKLAARGDRAGAARLYREVLAKFPANATARKGLGALSGPAPGKGARPRQPVRPAPGPGMAPPQADLAALSQALQRGQAQLVAQEGQRLAMLFPNAPALLNLVAMALARLGRLEDSLTWSDRLIAADPNFAGAHINKATALARMGRYGEVETEARAALALNPNLAPAHMLLGYALANTGRSEEAIAVFETAVRLAPGVATNHIGLGNALSSLARHEEALACFERARELAPDNGDVLNNIGNALAALGRIDEADDVLGAAVDMRPNTPLLRLNYARALRDHGDARSAIAQCRAALELDDTSTEAWALLGGCYKELGDREATLEALDRARALNPDQAEVLGLRWWLSADTSEHPDFARLLARADDPQVSTNGLVHLEMAIFGAYDRADQIDLAFPHLVRAKSLRHENEPYSMGDQQAMFDALRAGFTPPPEGLTPDDLAALPAPHRPLFVVGMPRSGTSLVEQILSSHSQVHGGGELTGIDTAMRLLKWDSGRIGEAPSRDGLMTLRRSYFDTLTRLGVDRPVVTDKTPLNFRYLGFMLAAMPEARVLVMRRDSRATCWSNFSNSFAGRANNFGNSMTDTAEMYRMHLDLIAFWQGLYPDRITVVPYERLTEQQEAESRKLVAAAGLDWEPACLDFHKTERSVRTASAMQVRKKMYTGSSEAWRRYEHHLGPMLDLLDGLDD